MKLEPPFDTFRIEKHAGERKDFGLAPDDPYPLKGVTYPVNYGDIEGYTGEDGARLDLFVGTNDNGIMGYIKVTRPDVTETETKFFIRVSVDDEAAILEQFKPVLSGHGRFTSQYELLHAVEVFKDKAES